MGTWGTGIIDNDTSNGVYSDFMELYAGDFPVEEILQRIVQENQFEINDYYERNNFWFAIGLASWETMSLNEETFQKIKEIIVSGSDLKIWKELDAEDKTSNKRKKELERFLKKISTPRKRPKPKSSIKIKPIFDKGDCLTFKLDNGNYGGAIVLESDKSSEFGFGYNLVTTTRINSKTLPTLSNFLESEILIINFDPETIKEARKQIVWFQPTHYRKRYSDIYSSIGSIEIKEEFTYDGSTYFGSSGWHLIKQKCDNQFDYEITNKKPTETIMVRELIKTLNN